MPLKDQTMNLQSISSIAGGSSQIDIRDGLKSGMTTSLGQTDKSLYMKVNGQAGLTEECFDVVESVLPCPHDPASLGHLYLEGQNKLEMEVQAAKKSGQLVVLNKKNLKFDKYSNVNMDTCLIEQEDNDND